MKEIKLSDFGNKMASEAGILQLMDDLGNAMNGEYKPVAMFGGGNPALIPEVTNIFKNSLQDIMGDEDRLTSMLGVYDTPQGNAEFINAVSRYLSSKFNANIRPENIAITPGSQTGFFMLFNILCGRSGASECAGCQGGTHTYSSYEFSLREAEEDVQKVRRPSIAKEKFVGAEEAGRVLGSAKNPGCRCVRRKLILPLVPEYIGYSDQLIEPGMISSFRPLIQKIGKHEFKYKIDFDKLKIDDETAGICVSRPTNPSGNVVSAEELTKLRKLAEEHNIPLIIDNAYGVPFPGVMRGSDHLEWNDNMVFSFSLSKVGLPSSRVGIFVGPSQLMSALTSTNAIVALANPSFGQYITTPLINSGEIDRISTEYVQPYYAERYKKAMEIISANFDDALPWRLHTYEGSYFLWLWLEGAKISSKQLYKKLKDRGVVIVPGEYFFAGQEAGDWSHARECIRINFARPDEELYEGMAILAEEIKLAYF